MVDLVDVQKVRARNELEKLHRGLVVDLEVKPPNRSAPADEPATGENGIDVSLAIEIVRETLETMEEFRTLASAQNDDLTKAKLDIRKLTADLDILRSKSDELTRENSDLRSAKQDLQQSMNQQRLEHQQLLAHNSLIEEKLRSLVNVIFQSFRKNQSIEGDDSSPRT